MFTTIDKAIVALILAVVSLASHAGVAIPAFLNESWVTTIVTLLIPVAVWFFPNKGGNDAKK